MPELAEQIVQRCRQMGFALAGVCRARPTAHAQELRNWLEAGRHGSMEYLNRNTELREDPRAMVEGARSIILVADQYAERGSQREAVPAGHARIARYARGDDYHEVMKKRLHALCDELREVHQGETFRAFVDTAPVLEREHASRAGLGWVAKHTLLIHPRRGSYLFLGGILTTLDLEPSESQQGVADHCGTCTRCIDACPTHAITPYSVDASRCISYLTIEHRGHVEEEFVEAVAGVDERTRRLAGEGRTADAGWIYGCDICQEVCPHNSPRPGGADAGEPHPAYAPRTSSFDLLDVLGWTEEDRRRAFRGSAMKRARLDMMKRNALLASLKPLREDPEGHAALRQRVEALADDDDQPEIVRHAAGQVLARLRGARPGR